jgi:fatty-acyl-CoA synthase
MTAYCKMDLKDQSFDPDGCLRTGDMGYLDEEDYLHLTGRFKDLIIHGGENIIPSEIAAVLTEFPAVKDAVVVAAASEFYGEDVAACLLLRDEVPYDQEELLNYVR